MFKRLFLLITCSFFVHISQTTASPLPQVIDRAHDLIGTPYCWGGNSEKSGFDCSGLMVYLFHHEADIKLPRTTAAMVKAGYKTVEKPHLKPGDAVFFARNGKGPINHVGLYIGDDKFIHAPRTGKNVRIDSLSNNYWRRSYKTAKRFHEPPPRPFNATAAQQGLALQSHQRSR